MKREGVPIPRKILAARLAAADEARRLLRRATIELGRMREAIIARRRAA